MKVRACVYAFVVVSLVLGVFAGCSKAPVRSDAQVVTDVQSKFYADPAIESRQIQVQAAGGVVTLSGEVSSESERTAAASDAATVAGVRTVVNNLEVRQAQLGPAPETPKEQEPAASKSTTRAKKNHVARMPTKGNDDQDAVNTPANNQQASSNQPQDATPAVQPPPPAPTPPPPPERVVIPAGTQLTVRLSDGLDTERNKIGDTFHASLSAPIRVNGETVIPSGADVTGRVANVQSAGRMTGSSVLTLELTSIAMNGKTYSIQTNQWSRSGKGEGKDTVTKVGIGTAAGAVLGGIFGGGKGAAIGAASGAGAGTGVAAAKKGEQIKLAPEAVLNFQTIDAITVTPQSSNDRDAGRTPVS